MGLPFLSNYKKQRKQRKIIKHWHNNGCPIPPPHLIKQQTILKWQKKFNFDYFIETGTYFGDMVEAMHKHFSCVYSIELSPQLYDHSVKRFKGVKNVKLVQGDSAVELQKIMTTLPQPALFWLDGHYSAGVTARGKIDTPIMQELQDIYNSPLGKNSVVLIDDAHCFGQDKDYPTIKQVEEYVKSKISHVDITVENNVICIIPTKRD